MARWRPAPPKTSPYITAEGARRLQEELKQLWKVVRPEVTATVKAAAANGDRSENGDYIYGKMRLRELDRRIRYLSKRLDNLNVVDRLPSDQSKVFFGAWVSLEHEDGQEFSVRIVGYDEIDAKQNWISVDSPLAKAALGKQVDDEISYDTPNGVAEAYIVKISYQIQ
jgi:transcription elongation factor GreB